MKNATSISSAENIVFATILCFVGIAGIVGNILVIFNFAKQFKRFFFLRSFLQSWFFDMIGMRFHLAIANIMLLLTIPFYISEKHRSLSQSGCKLYKGIIYFTYSISLLAFLARIVLRLIFDNYGKWKDHERFYTKQYYVLRHLCASTLPIVLQTTYLTKLRKKNYKKIYRFNMQNKHFSFLFVDKFSVVSTILIYAISVFIALPAFSYSDKNGFEVCSCNIVFPGAENTFGACEELAANFPEFDFNCPTKHCISQQEVSDFRSATENVLRNIANQSNELNMNIISSINTTSRNDMIFHSTTTNLVDFNEFQNFSVVISQENCLDNLKQAGIPLKFYIWFNFLYLFLAFLFIYVCIKFTFTRIRRHGVQLLGNKPKLLRNNRKFRASIKQNIDECRNEFFKVKFEEKFLIFIVFAICWFIYFLIEIIKLHFYFGLSEAVCRILSDVSMAIIYINAGFNIFIHIFQRRRHYKQLILKDYKRLILKGC